MKELISIEHETYWPKDRVYVVLTKNGRIAKEHGRYMLFADDESAAQAMKPGQRLGGITIFRVTVFAEMTAKEGA